MNHRWRLAARQNNDSWKNCELCLSVVVSLSNRKKNYLGVEEDVDHLLFACSFATRCWQKLHIQWDLSLDIHSRIMQAKDSSPLLFLIEILLIAAWEIWKLRNTVIF